MTTAWIRPSSIHWMFELLNFLLLGGKSLIEDHVDLEMRNMCNSGKLAISILLTKFY